MKYIDYIGVYCDCWCSIEEVMYYENVVYQGLLKWYLWVSLINGVFDNFWQVFYVEQLDNYMVDFGLIMEGQLIFNIGDVFKVENDYICIC